MFINSLFWLTLSLHVRGTVKNTFKTKIKVATLQLCNFSTIHSHGSILAKSIFASISLHSVRPLQPGRRLCPLQLPGRWRQLPARNELRRRKEINFFPVWPNFEVNFLGQFYEFINIVSFHDDREVFFWKKVFHKFRCFASPRGVSQHLMRRLPLKQLFIVTSLVYF